MTEIMIGEILPAQTVYVQEVIAAEQEYQKAVRDAWNVRKVRVDRALSVCLLALNAISDQARPEASTNEH